MSAWQKGFINNNETFHNVYYDLHNFLTTALLCIIYLPASSVTQCFSFFWTILTDLYLQLVLFHPEYFLTFIPFCVLFIVMASTIELVAQLVGASVQACVIRNIIGLGLYTFEVYSRLVIGTLPCTVWVCSVILSISRPHHGDRQNKKQKAGQLFKSNKTIKVQLKLNIFSYFKDYYPNGSDADKLVFGQLVDLSRVHW